MTQKDPAAWMWTMQVERRGRRCRVSWSSLWDEQKGAAEELTSSVFPESRVIKVIGKEPLYFEEPEEGLCECEKKEKILSEFDKIL